MFCFYFWSIPRPEAITFLLSYHVCLNFGIWSHLLNKVFNVIFHEKKSGWLRISSTEQHWPFNNFACSCDNVSLNWNYFYRYHNDRKLLWRSNRRLAMCHHERHSSCRRSNVRPFATTNSSKFNDGSNCDLSNAE
jgi:hypothetical protein